jgi:hypothetical protein
MRESLETALRAHCSLEHSCTGRFASAPWVQERKYVDQYKTHILRIGNRTNRDRIELWDQNR